MNCGKAEKMISLYLDNELKEAQKQEMLLHIDSCPKCRKNFEFTNEILQNLRSEDHIDVSPYFFQKLQRRIKENENREFFPLFNPRFAFASAAALSIIIGSSFFAGALIGNDYLAQTDKSETASIQEAKSALKLETLEEYPEGSVGNLYNKALGGA